MSSTKKLQGFMNRCQLKNAANIINELPTEQAAEQLMYVKTSTRADILARLSPEKSSRSDKSH
ncbi:MAG: hypothetical protein LRY71_09320 [Bacillaceae bacterium]|nr:hypothetical protein [Bacillaceae bacterium]